MFSINVYSFMRVVLFWLVRTKMGLKSTKRNKSNSQVSEFFFRFSTIVVVFVHIVHVFSKYTFLTSHVYVYYNIPIYQEIYFYICRHFVRM